MTNENISSKENKLFKLLKNLTFEKRNKSTQDIFYTEGLRAFESFQDRYTLIDIVISEYSKPKDHIAKFNPKVFSGDLWSQLNHQPSPTDLIAIWERKKNASINTAPDKVLILDCVQDPGNAGTLLRSALGADFSSIICTKGTVDMYSPKVLRSSAEAIAQLNIHTNIQFTDCIEFLQKEEYQIVLANAHADTDIKDFSPETKVALILGNEGHGLSDEWSDLDNISNIKIMHNEKLESLNVGVAGSVIMLKLANVI